MPLVTSPSDIRGYSQANQPAVVPEGGLWYDTSVDTLYVSDGSTFNTIGASSFAGAAVVSQSVTIGNYTTPTSATASSPTGTMTVSYLVIAGGGSSGGACAGKYAGGGGSGGYKTASGYTVSAQAYSITVGAGGSGSTGCGSDGFNGGNSIFDTITSTGGGYGGAAGAGGSAGGNGGSGGGGGSGSLTSIGGTGTVGQGNNGGTATTTIGGAGGGSSSAGVGATAGAGTSSSITGSPVTRATGGAGNTGIAGGANTGDGGSSGNTLNAYNAGGSGIVIISYTTIGLFTATGGTITTSGANTIHSFTSSGTFTVSNTATSSLNIFDNNTATRWTSNSEINPNCYVDQGSALNFAAAAFFYDNTNTTATSMLIQTSADSVTWTTKRTITTSNLVSGYNFYRFNIATGVRYVRFYGNDSGAKVLSLYEVKIYQRTNDQILNDLGILEISPTDTTLNAAGT